jgi:hypothetical protein
MNFTGACSHREAKALSLLSFCNSDSFRAPSNTLPVLDLDLRQPSMMLKISGAMHSHSPQPDLSLHRLATGSSVRPLLTCMARITQINSELNDNESLTVEPPRRTLCGGIQLHSMKESPGSTRGTIETHFSFSQVSNLICNHIRSI